MPRGRSSSSARLPGTANSQLPAGYISSGGGGGSSSSTPAGGSDQRKATLETLVSRLLDLEESIHMQEMIVCGVKRELAGIISDTRDLANQRLAPSLGAASSASSPGRGGAAGSGSGLLRDMSGFFGRRSASSRDASDVPMDDFGAAEHSPAGSPVLQSRHDPQQSQQQVPAQLGPPASSQQPQVKFGGVSKRMTAALSNAALHLIGGKRSPTSSGPASESGEPTGDVNNEPTQGKTRVGSIGDAMGSGGLGHAGEIANANTSSGKVSQHNLQQAQSRSHSQSTPSRPSTSTARHSETGTDGPSVPGAAMGSLTGLSGQPTSAVADAAQQPSESSPKAAHLRQVLLRTAQHPATAHSRADSHDPARRSPLAMTVRNADEAQSINSLASSAASSDLESKGHSYAAANAHRASFSGFASPDSLNNSLTIPSTTQTLTRRSDPEHNHHSSQQQQQQQQQQDQDQSVTESGPATTTSSALAVTGLSIATSSAVNPLSVQPSVVKSLSTPRISVSNSDNLTPSFVIHPASPSSPSHPDYAGDFPDEAGESAGMQGDYSGSGLPAEDDTDYDYVDPLQQADPTAQHSAGASNAGNTSSHSSAGKRSNVEPGGNMDAANMPAPAIPPHLAPTLSTSSMSRDDLRPSQVEGRLHDVGRAATQSQPPPSPSGGLFDLPEQFRHIVVAVDAPIPTPTPLHLRGHLDQLHSQLQSGSQMNLVGANGSAGIVPVNVLPVGLVRHQQHQQHQSSQANLSTLAQGASASGGIVASRSMQMQMQTPAYRPPGQNMSAESTMSVASPTQRAPAAGPPGSAMGDTMQPFSYDPLQTAAAGVLTIVDSAVGPPTRSIQVHVTEKQQQQNKETAAAEQERSAPSSPLGSSNGHTHVAPTPATTSMIGMSSLNGHEATVAGNGGAGSGGAGGRGHASSTRSGGGSSSSSNAMGVPANADKSPPPTAEATARPSLPDPVKPPAPSNVEKSSLLARVKRFFSRDTYMRPLALSTSSGMSHSLLALSPSFPGLVLIHPHSYLSQLWASVIFVVRVIMLFILPLSLGFEDAYTWLPFVSIPFAVFSAVDVWVVAHTAMIIEKTIEMDIRKVMRSYLSSGSMVFDLVCAMPWVWVTDGLTKPGSNAQWMWRLVCVVHGLPSIKQLMGGRISLLSEITKGVIRQYNMPTTAVSLVSIVCAMFTYWHWAACATSFLKHLNVIPDHHAKDPWVDRYTLGFYSSAAEMLAAGFGAEVPEVSADRWFKIGNMILSALFSAIFIGNISSFMIGLDSSGRMFNEKIEEVNQYISYKGFNADIKRRILSYYQLKYSQGKFFDENKILSELNQPLRQFISLQECQSLILKVPFFKDADRFFISQVVMILRINHFLPGDFVIEEGTTGDQMFFISSGTLEVIVGGAPRAKLSPGLFFGEIALLYGRMRRTASIRAATNCILYSLSRPDLNSILEGNPVMADKMRKVAEERLANDAKFKKSSSPQPSQMNLVNAAGGPGGDGGGSNAAIGGNGGRMNGPGSQMNMVGSQMNLGLSSANLRVDGSQMNLSSSRLSIGPNKGGASGSGPGSFMASQVHLGPPPTLNSSLTNAQQMQQMQQPNRLPSRRQSSLIVRTRELGDGSPNEASPGPDSGGQAAPTSPAKSGFGVRRFSLAGVPSSSHAAGTRSVSVTIGESDADPNSK